MSEKDNDKKNDNENNKKKKKKLSLNMGDISGKVVEKTASPKESPKQESLNEDKKKKCNNPDCNCNKASTPNVETVSFEEEIVESEIRLHVKGVQVKLEDISQEDFLSWVENVLPLSKDKFQRLQKIDFSNYDERKKLFEHVAKYHENILVEDLKSKGYGGFPLI